MDQDETWHGGRPQPRPQCVRWRPSSPERGTAAPSFRPMSIVAKRSPILTAAEHLFVFGTLRCYEKFRYWSEDITFKSKDSGRLPQWTLPEAVFSYGALFKMTFCMSQLNSMQISGNIS